jgi:hypothetical protein
MSKPILKCFSCKNEIPIGKYYQLHKDQNKIGDYCSPCWTKEQVKYEVEIKKGLLKVVETERERERETKNVKYVILPPM